MAFSPDGRLLASAGQECLIRLWDIETGDCRQTIMAGEAGIWSVRFLPDGERLVSVGEDLVERIWHIESGRCEHCLRGHTDATMSIAIHPTGKLIATGSFDATIRRTPLRRDEHHQRARLNQGAKSESQGAGSYRR